MKLPTLLCGLVAVAAFGMAGVAMGADTAPGKQAAAVTPAQNGQAREQGDNQNGQAGEQGEHQNGQAGERGEHQNGQAGEQGDQGNGTAAKPASPKAAVPVAPKGNAK